MKKNKVVIECQKLIDTNGAKESCTMQELEKFDNLCDIVNLCETISHDINKLLN